MDFACCRLTERADWMVECGEGGRKVLSLTLITCFVYIHSERGPFWSPLLVYEGSTNGVKFQGGDIGFILI